MSTSDLYESVTNRIIAELEAGAAPWLKPWKTSKANGQSIMPYNAITGRNYHGINVVILWGQRDAKGYDSNSWMTFKQAKEKGGCVRKGETATQVVFTKKLRVKDKETDEEKQISMLRGYWVFNSQQIDGLPTGLSTTSEEVDNQELRHQRAECFITAIGADIRHSGNEAFFVPAKDFIQVPPFSAFKTTEGYYATNLHELTHWSGHTTRLDRNLSGRFGTRAYAAEELVAELGSAFLCAHLGIEGDLRHAGL